MNEQITNIVLTAGDVAKWRAIVERISLCFVERFQFVWEWNRAQKIWCEWMSCLDLFHDFSLNAHFQCWFFFSLSTEDTSLFESGVVLMALMFRLSPGIIIYKIGWTNNYKLINAEWFYLGVCVWDLSIIMMAS